MLVYRSFIVYLLICASNFEYGTSVPQLKRLFLSASGIFSCSFYFAWVCHFDKRKQHLICQTCGSRLGALATPTRPACHLFAAAATMEGRDGSHAATWRMSNLINLTTMPHKGKQMQQCRRPELSPFTAAATVVVFPAAAAAAHFQFVFAALQRGL